MSTNIFPSPIYGPIKSRRLGLSLGINLLPDSGKICNFDCLYCECGFNKDRHPTTSHPTKELVIECLEQKLIDMHNAGTLPDVLTFAGNGEPTSHPHFPEIIETTIRLRNKWCPNAKISVLSNATFIAREAVRKALMQVDNNILKLDTVDNDYIRKVNRPTQPSFDIQKIIDQMKRFEGKLIIQTMFMKGDGIDNTDDKFVLPWLQSIKEIRPQSVMIYTIDRETPDKNLKKATPAELDRIRDKVIAAGFPCTVAY